MCVLGMPPTAHRDRAKWAKWATPCVTVRMDSQRAFLTQPHKNRPFVPKERLKCLTRLYSSSPAMTLPNRRRCQYHRAMTRIKGDKFVHAPGQLMGLMELSQFLVGHTNNNGYTHRIAAKATFPKPYAELHVTRIWLKDEVAAWAREHRPQAPGLKDLD